MPFVRCATDSCLVRMLSSLACVGIVTVAVAGCSAPARALPASDALAVSMCRQADFAALDDHGLGFRASGHPRLLRAYASTGRVLNTWRWTDQEGPGARNWPGEADGRSMAVCYFDGSFHTTDGRTYARALIETDGRRFRLIVADERNRVDVKRPPRA